MPKHVSVETVHSLFRIHGYSTKEMFSSQAANVVMQALIDSKRLTESDLEAAKKVPHIDIFLMLKIYVSDTFADQLSDSDLFAVLEMLETLSFLIDTTTGLNLPAQPVFLFFTGQLKQMTGGNLLQST